ncbi:MAG: hypothetical protein ACI8W7_001859, partial [Gammaproteobacteria bacterium]
MKFALSIRSLRSIDFDQRQRKVGVAFAQAKA